MKTLRILKYVGFGILGIGFLAFAIFITMSLWNWLIPELFKGPVLTYWQTAGLFLLSKILLTGIAPSTSDNKHKKKWHSKYHGKYDSHCHEEKDETEPQMA